MRESKVCSKCKRDKNLRFFDKSRFNDDGYKAKCKRCTKEVEKRREEDTKYKQEALEILEAQKRLYTDLDISIFRTEGVEEVEPIRINELPNNKVELIYSSRV